MTTPRVVPKIGYWLLGGTCQEEPREELFRVDSLQGGYSVRGFGECGCGAKDYNISLKPKDIFIWAGKEEIIAKFI